jgi:hypothetical protein
MLTEYEEFDHDVLAVLKRGDVEITFVSSPSASLDGKNFSVVSWTIDKITIAVAEEYLNKDIDDFIVSGILSTVGDDATEEETVNAVREHAIQLFSAKLTEVFRDAVTEVDDPLKYSLDYALDQLLDEQ